MNDDISQYLSGEKLYGDDFTIDEIKEWFADEEEGYADLGAKEKDKYQYVYHELNKLHAYKYVNHRVFNDVLGVGSAYGDEFKPILNKLNKITILDPSEAFSDVQEVLGVACEYIRPCADGNMPFRSNRFDLITSFGVMHHIPNVSHVMSECYRCLSNNGIMLLREPIVSMGDWTRPRNGLTKRERGIPLKILRGMIRDIGFKVSQDSLCDFPLIPKLANSIGLAAFNNYTITMLDKLLSKMFSWNIKYHRTKLNQKFAPASVFFVLEK